MHYSFFEASREEVFSHYSFFEASYCSIVFDWMITVVSPRWMLDEVVVIVRVTLQLVSTVAAPTIIRAIAAHRIFMMRAFMMVSF